MKTSFARTAAIIALGLGASASFAAEHWVRYPKDIQLQERP